MQDYKEIDGITKKFETLFGLCIIRMWILRDYKEF